MAPKGSHLPPLEQTLLPAGHQPPKGSGCCSKTLVRPPHTVWFFRLSPPPISWAIFSDPFWTANLALDARASFRRACHMALTTPPHPPSERSAPTQGLQPCCPRTSSGACSPEDRRLPLLPLMILPLLPILASLDVFSVPVSVRSMAISLRLRAAWIFD